MFGIPQFRAIINPPEAAILAVGAIVKRAVVIDDGIHIRPMMNITASGDHRILDGVALARFLQRVKQLLESAPAES
jgi:pyruvate dehydrogenase E2 component (dihydrolipoamide acetyltransferase)